MLILIILKTLKNFNILGILIGIHFQLSLSLQNSLSLRNTFTISSHPSIHEEDASLTKTTCLSCLEVIPNQGLVLFGQRFEFDSLHHQIR